MNEKQLIKTVMDEFDFNKAHKIMTDLNWTWCDDGVPTISEIKEHVKFMMGILFKSVHENPEQNVSYLDGGGFLVYYDKEADYKLSLIFHVVSSDA